MIGQKQVYEKLNELKIEFEYLEHPPVPTIEAAIRIRGKINGVFCKNLFFRNHKGNRHYLIIIEHSKQMQIRDLEQKLKQGKLSFASEKRMMKYLGLTPGSVSAFGIINDTENHVHVFLDSDLKNADKVSFHPNDNRATLILKYTDFMVFMNATGNSFEFIEL